MRVGSAQLAALLAVLTLAAAAEHYNPTAHITATSYDRRCTMLKVNHPERIALEGVAVVPSSGRLAERTRGWVQRYAAALAAKDVHALKQLKAADSGVQLVRSATFQREEPWFDFIQLKIELFDLLEAKLGLQGALWRAGASLLDVGCGHGFVDAFLAHKYSMEIVGYDIPNSYQCEEMMASSLMLNFFNGSGLPVGARSFDGISFMGVLHHAARATARLLEEAARVAREWIVVVEDLDIGTARNAKRNHKHDPRGIFRTNQSWLALFREHCAEFEVVAQSFASSRLRVGSLALGVRGQNPWVYGYALRRRGGARRSGGSGGGRGTALRGRRGLRPRRTVRADAAAAASKERCACGDARGRVPIGDDASLDRSQPTRLAAAVRRFDTRHDKRTRSLDMRHLRACMMCAVSEDANALPQHLGELRGKQLFVDDYLISSAVGVERFLASPEYHPEAVMSAADERFEAHGRYGFGYPGSVHHNGTHFVMHYIAGRARHRSRVDARTGKTVKESVGAIAVAVSQDGFKWTGRRALDVFTPAGGNGGEHCVLHDVHEPEPSLRWKMVHNCNHPIDETCLAYSADGITWRAAGHKWGRNADRQGCLYHDSVGGGYEYMLPDEFPTPHSFRDIRGMQLNHVSDDAFRQALLSSDTAGSDPARGRVPFVPDGKWYFDRYRHEQYERVIYSQTRTLYEGVYLNLVSVLHWPMPGVIPGFKNANKSALFAGEGGTIEGWLHDRVVPYLATSRDRKRFNWQWVYAKQPLIRGDASRSDSMRIIMPAAQIVTRDGWHWVYFAGTNRPHTTRWSGECKIYLARWRQDRVSGLETACGEAAECGEAECGEADCHSPGVVITKPFRFPRGALSLSVNLDVAPPRDVAPPQGGSDSTRDHISRATVGLASANGTLLHPRLLRVTAESHKGARVTEARVAHLSLHLLGDVQLRFIMDGRVRLYAFTIACGPCGCDSHPTDITCDKGNAFSKGLSGFNFAGQRARAVAAATRMAQAIGRLEQRLGASRVRIDSLLEYGCATGITTRAAKEALPNVRSAIGIDVDDAALRSAQAGAGDSRIEYLHADQLGERTADLVLCQHVITVDSADELASKVLTLFHFARSPGGLLWIIFKKEAHKHAVDEYVARLPTAEHVYMLHGVAADAEHSPTRSKQRDAYLYLLLTRRAAHAGSRMEPTAMALADADLCVGLPDPFAPASHALSAYAAMSQAKVARLWERHAAMHAATPPPCEAMREAHAAGVRSGPLGLDVSAIGPLSPPSLLRAVERTIAYFTAECKACAVVSRVDQSLRVAPVLAAPSVFGFTWLRRALWRADSYGWVASEAERFRRDGFLQVASWAPWGLSDFPKLLAQAAGEVQRLHVLGATTNKAHFSTARLEALEPLVSSRAVHLLASQYLGAPVKIDGYKIVHTSQRLTRETYLSANWHHDGCGTRLKLFVYLDQVLSSNGATRVAAGSHRQIYYAAGKSNAGMYFSDRHIEASYRVHAMEGAAGGGFIFDTNAAHRGHVDGASKGRDAIVVDMLAVPKAHALGKGVGFSCPEKIRYPLDITGPS